MAPAALTAIVSAMAEVRTAAENTSEIVRSATEQILGDQRRMTESLEQGRDRNQELARESQEASQRALGDLQFYLDQLSGPWAEELQLQLEAIRIGAQDIETFNTTYGQVVVTMEDGGQRIQEFLNAIDPQAFQDKVRELTQAIDTGAASIEEALDLLTDAGGKVTEQFLAAVDAFRRGDASLDIVRRKIEQLRDLVGDGPLTDFLEEIAEQLALGERQR